VCYLGIAQAPKNISKWKINATRNRGFEAEIGDLYIGEKGSTKKLKKQQHIFHGPLDLVGFR
jgi:hypothetical protein